jgi:hypothetical protein
VSRASAPKATDDININEGLGHDGVSLLSLALVLVVGGWLWSALSSLGQGAGTHDGGDQFLALRARFDVAAGPAPANVVTSEMGVQLGLEVVEAVTPFTAEIDR